MADETPQDDVARYAAAVRAALSDLAPDEREVLLEDLEQHLAEVRAESDAPLTSRLGSPDAYARELRAAYGAPGHARRRRFPRIRRTVGVAVSRLTASKSYQAVREYLPELRPAWWVLRAYLVVLVLAVMFRGDQTIHPIPNPFTSGGLVETIAMAFAVVISIKLGRWSGRPERTAHWPLYAANAVVAFSGLLALGTMSTLPDWIAYSGQVQDGMPNAYAAGPTTNLYPYSADGKPLDGVLIYDQDGRPVIIDASGYGIITEYPTGADGQPITNEYPLRQTRSDGSSVIPPRVAVPPVAPSPSPSASASPSPSP